MADGQSIVEPKVELMQSSLVDAAPQYDYGNQSDAQLFNMDVNYANENKWFGMFQLEDVLGKNYKNLNLHITRFSIPQLVQGTMEASFRGYSKEMPTKVLMPSSKEITVEYIVDSEWKNYRALYALVSNINGTLNPVSDDEKKGILPSEYLPFRIYLLGPYKKKLISFLFEDTWIKVFNELSLDVNSPNEVKHSFTLSFSQYKIEDV